jgi:hypothetical protein
MITVAQLGCGYWGPNLLRNFSAQPECHVKWVADEDLSDAGREITIQRKPLPIGGAINVMDAVIIATGLTSTRWVGLMPRAEKHLCRETSPCAYQADTGAAGAEDN